MKIYVAGSSKELPRVKRVMAELRAAGHEITFDWVAHIESVGGNALPIGELRRTSALADVRGIIQCDVFVYLHPAQGAISAGACFEFGFNMALIYWAMIPDSDEEQEQLTDGALMLAMNDLPTVISYEREIFDGPLLFDALVERGPVLDADLPYTLQSIAMYEHGGVL